MADGYRHHVALKRHRADALLRRRRAIRLLLGDAADATGIAGIARRQRRLPTVIEGVLGSVAAVLAGTLADLPHQVVGRQLPLQGGDALRQVWCTERGMTPLRRIIRLHGSNDKLAVTFRHSGVTEEWQGRSPRLLHIRRQVGARVAVRQRHRHRHAATDQRYTRAEANRPAFRHGQQLGAGRHRYPLLNGTVVATTTSQRRQSGGPNFTISPRHQHARRADGCDRSPSSGMSAARGNWHVLSVPDSMITGPTARHVPGD